jgi:hypothetical protein
MSINNAAGSPRSSRVRAVSTATTKAVQETTQWLQVWTSHQYIYSERRMIMAKVNPIQLQKYLKGMDYPASKQELIAHAEQQGADENVRATLEQLPDEQFQTPADVSQAIGQIE